MELRDAYRMVYNDILNKGGGLFVGKCDHKNGSDQFMYGIQTVMEFIAYEVSEKNYEDFQDLWFANFLEEKD